MTTTGTYTFNPGLGGLMAYALGRCGIRRPAITVDHLADAAMAGNLVLQSWGNTQPNFWTVDLQTVTLIQGQQTITCPADTIQVLDVYITITYSAGNFEDRILWPIGRSEYAAYPIKTEQGVPSVFWFDRVIPPTLTLYYVPDGNATYTLNYYRVRQLQDAAMDAATTLDFPPRFLMAFADAIAVELAYSYAADRLPGLIAKATQSKRVADEQDAERVPTYISPGLWSYYRS